MKRFPIMIDRQGTKGPCPSSIPWDAIAPYEKMAQVNHDQTLERLAERGGLCDVEAFFVMTGRTWDDAKMSDDLEREACAFLDKIVKEEGALALQNHELRKALKWELGDEKRDASHEEFKKHWEATERALALTPTHAEKGVAAMEKVCVVARGEIGSCPRGDKGFLHKCKSWAIHDALAEYDVVRESQEV